MQPLRVTHLFSGLAVRDFSSAKSWYERLFGRPPDMLPHDTEAVWNLAEGGLVYVVEDGERAGAGLLMLIVPDLEETLAAVAGRGLGSAAVQVLASGTRKATLTDPDGNRISFGQV